MTILRSCCHLLYHKTYWRWLNEDHEINVGGGRGKGNVGCDNNNEKKGGVSQSVYGQGQGPHIFAYNIGAPNDYYVYVYDDDYGSAKLFNSRGEVRELQTTFDQESKSSSTAFLLTNKHLGQLYKLP